MQHLIKRIGLPCLCALWLLSGASLAYAEVTAEHAKAYVGHTVDLTLTSGESQTILVQEQSGNFIVVQDENGRTDVVTLHEIAAMKSAENAPDTSDEHALTSGAETRHAQVIDDAIERAERERLLKKEVRKTGRGLVISGSILLGVGLTMEVWALAIAIQTNRSDDYGLNRVFGATAALTGALIGAPFVVVGSGLLAGGLVKRGKARKAAKRDLEYSLAPALHYKGAGAQLRLNF